MNITGTAADITHLHSLGEQIEDTLANLLAYIEANNIFEQWNAAQRDLAAQTCIEWTYYDSPFYDDSRIDWTISLTSEGLAFTGEDRERDKLHFIMPYGFLSEETREETLNTLRERYTAIAARQADRKRVTIERDRDAAQHDRDRAQARLDAINAQQA